MRWLPRIAIIVLLLASAGAVLALRRSTPSEELAAAQRRWAERPFSRYRLVVDIESTWQRCRQEVEVHNEQVVAVLRNTCGQRGLTVSALFSQIAASERRGQKRCTNPAVVVNCFSNQLRADYDPQLGYPRRRMLLLFMEVRWGFVDFLRRVLPPANWPSGTLQLRREGVSVVHYRELEVVTVHELRPLP
jgi:hypothetical protein